MGTITRYSKQNAAHGCRNSSTDVEQGKSRPYIVRHCAIQSSTVVQQDVARGTALRGPIVVGRRIHGSVARLMGDCGHLSTIGHLSRCHFVIDCRARASVIMADPHIWHI